MKPVKGRSCGRRRNRLDSTLSPIHAIRVEAPSFVSALHVDNLGLDCVCAPVHAPLLGCICTRALVPSIGRLGVGARRRALRGALSWRPWTSRPEAARALWIRSARPPAPPARSTLAAPPSLQRAGCGRVASQRGVVVRGGPAPHVRIHSHVHVWVYGPPSASSGVVHPRHGARGLVILALSSCAPLPVAAFSSGVR